MTPANEGIEPSKFVIICIEHPFQNNTLIHTQKNRKKMLEIVSERSIELNLAGYETWAGEKRSVCVWGGGGGGGVKWLSTSKSEKSPKTDL